MKQDPQLHNDFWVMDDLLYLRDKLFTPSTSFIIARWIPRLTTRWS